MSSFWKSKPGWKKLKKMTPISYESSDKQACERKNRGPSSFSLQCWNAVYLWFCSLATTTSRFLGRALTNLILLFVFLDIAFVSKGTRDSHRNTEILTVYGFAHWPLRPAGFFGQSIDQFNSVVCFLWRRLCFNRNKRFSLKYWKIVCL